MGILMPMTVPLVYEVLGGIGSTDAGNPILLGTIGGVLAGSIFGDHCSPISDTTVMSSMASACDHIDHVRTQLPYALTVAFTGMLLGDIPTSFGLPPWISLVLGAGVLFVLLRFIGKRADDAPEVIEIPAAVAVAD
jgi:Na+/H+ antiporter NhaC